MHPKRITADAVVARIAARQHGVISLAQLYAAGLTPEAVKVRIATGRLFRVHRGVYAVGHRGLTDRGRWKAATLAVDDAVLSHRSAAELWDLLPRRGADPHVTVPYPASPRPRDGIRIHRSRTLARARTTMRDGIPVTMPSRTLADLRRTVTAGEWRQAVREADYRDLPLDFATDKTRSEPEADFLEVCRRFRIPSPEVNRSVGRYTVDFLWRREALVVEVDGYAGHRGRQAFEDDHRRELELGARGLRVLRFSDHQVARSAAEVAAAVMRALAP